MYKDSTISIGIYWPVFASVGHVLRTLETIAVSSMPGPVGICVFADGNRMSADELPAYVSLIGNDYPRGKAWCFNRLVSHPSADYFVWLEAGLLLAPSCLEKLIITLKGQPYYGLAGPSANSGWNEQTSLLSSFSGTNYRAVAALIGQQYADMHSTLDPLYSLSDCCYVVKKEVIEKIGAADESYGEAPCWEMDYNIRAAREGFKGLWVKDAVAWRTLSWPAEDVEKGRKLYQSRFCSLQLSFREHTSPQGHVSPERQASPEGHASPRGREFKEHCRGDQCSNFADPRLIRTKIDLPPSFIPSLSSPTLFPSSRSLSFPPLVSCIMPTAGRPHFIKKAIQYFRQQDYPCKELIIVYNDPSDLPADLLSDAHRDLLTGDSIKLVQSPAKSIGAKRNEACRHARGPIIAQWDDDDMYHTQRLSRQVQPILEGAAEMTGLHSILFYEPVPDKCWSCSPELFRRLFMENIAAGTLVYLKSYWMETGYPEISLREDAEFMTRALRKGARLQKIDGSNLFIYLRHGANTWRFRTGTYLQQTGWSEVPLPDWAVTLSGCVTTPPAQSVPPPQPLVSCIMPTADRQAFIPAAIRYFLEQDYGHKELIIVDNGRIPVDHLVPADPRINYLRLPATGIPVGQLRNYACEKAKGEIIVHWDDDDWYAPGWVSYQVKSLQTSGADLTGLARVLFYAPYTNTAWKYVYPGTERPWVAGATMAYRRSLWVKYRFKNMRIGEDNDFAWQSGGKIFAHDWENGFVSIIHPSNTSPKNTRDRRWQSYPVQQVLDILLNDSVTQHKIYDTCQQR